MTEASETETKATPAAEPAPSPKPRRRLKAPPPMAAPVRWRRAALTLSALALMSVGFLVLGAALADRAAKIALADGPPPPFSSLAEALAAPPSPTGEIALRAQLDLPRAYIIRDGIRDAFVAPLYAETDQRPGDEVAAVLFEPSGAAPDAAFANWARAAGPAGTIVEFRGAPARAGPRTRRRIAEALESEGLTLAPDAVFIEPFLESRRRELAPSAAPLVFGGLVIAAGALLGLYGALARPRRRGEGTPRAPG
ncbi:MAG: hypothetical protein AAGM38_02920 [Pseudomonadota bacterium]